MTEPTPEQVEASLMAIEYVNRYSIGVRELAWLLGTSRSTTHDLMSQRGHRPAIRAMRALAQSGEEPRDPWTVEDRMRLSELLDTYEDHRAEWEEFSAVAFKSARRAADPDHVPDRPTRRLLRQALEAAQ